MKTQVSGLRKELETTKKHLGEVSEKFGEKNRQYQKLQVSYNFDNNSPSVMGDWGRGGGGRHCHT